ncbi:metallophosphoesterase [Treponema zioleckii]|uniref:metallophosphoesterase n=1 Tax=Treponema zioleckii TaxID=331680 RepID=UPI00168AD36A|nr:metallophosphoesterase [Treponema zioleckii]
MAVFILFVSVIGFLLGLYAFFLLRRNFTFLHVNTKSKKIFALEIFLAAVIGIFCANTRFLLGLLLLQILFLSMIFDLVLILPNKKVSVPKILRSGLIPLALVLPLNIWGYFNLNKIVRTEYNLFSPKLERDYKVVFLSDVHWGTIQKKDAFKSKIEEINAEGADFIILGGDMVDEGTSKDDMKEIFSLCKELKSRYGTYFIYGNHDIQQYSRFKNFTIDELNDAICSNNIKILADSIEEFESDLILVGRKDYGFSDEAHRKTMNELLLQAEKNRFTFVADHQPRNVEQNAAEKIDLQISGHTHAGQIFPIGRIMALTGNYVYGEYKKDDLALIVSSGIAGWGYPVKTEKVCEYVVVNLKSKKK